MQRDGGLLEMSGVVAVALHATGGARHDDNHTAVRYSMHCILCHQAGGRDCQLACDDSKSIN